jgi:hypothetical protein
MGKLRAEPKVKPFLSEEQYQHYFNKLKEAQNASNENNVYWDLDKNENPNHARKAFLHVAEKENIPVRIRRERGSKSLAFSFKSEGRPTGTRMSSDESRMLILKALGDAKKPMQKSEIIDVTGISPSTWNVRIRELMRDKKVSREGERRDTKYTLA